jgi:hypothetical protein
VLAAECGGAGRCVRPVMVLAAAGALWQGHRRVSCRRCLRLCSWVVLVGAVICCWYCCYCLNTLVVLVRVKSRGHAGALWQGQ